MSAAGPGGRRKGQGRSSAFQEGKAKESTALEMQKLFDAIPEDDKKAVVAALIARAKGVRVLAKVEWKGARRILIESEEEFEDSYGEPCWLYTLAPDTTAGKALLDHLKGRASTQPRIETDTVINLVHAVTRPGRKR